MKTVIIDVGGSMRGRNMQIFAEYTFRKEYMEGDLSRLFFSETQFT